MALLRVTGTIDLSQFWPKGTSDADTTKIIVDVPQDAFQVRLPGSAAFVATHVFDNATVVGATRKRAVTNGRITVRLQGIDAPELHYRPAAIPRKLKPTDQQRAAFKAVNKEYRQRLGETSTVALADSLRSGWNDGSDPVLPCSLLTQVDVPGDVFDTYGRFVGDIAVDVDNQQRNVNQWLVSEGWAVPTFYTSMTAEEINTLRAAWAMGRKKPKRVGKSLTRTIGAFDATLRYRGKGVALDPANDAGKLILPKLFRRQCTFFAYRKAKVVPPGFRRYLESAKDGFYLTDNFLENGVHSAELQLLHEHVDSDNRFDLNPDDLVFREKASKLVGPDNQPILGWDVA